MVGLTNRRLTDGIVDRWYGGQMVWLTDGMVDKCPSTTSFWLPGFGATIVNKIG